MYLIHTQQMKNTFIFYLSRVWPGHGCDMAGYIPDTGGKKEEEKKEILSRNK